MYDSQRPHEYPADLSNKRRPQIVINQYPEKRIYYDNLQLHLLFTKLFITVLLHF